MKRYRRRVAMRKARGKGLVTGYVLMALFLANIVITPQIAQAAAGVQLNPAITLTDNLVALKGKTVTVSLSSGQTITGVVKEVQNNLLYLEKLSQKEFYDALIRVDLIAAIEVRAR
jgi:hypothetical protein